MDAPLSISELRAAVDTVADAFMGRKVVTMATWDAVLPVLIQSYPVLGGHSRQLVHRLFAATYSDDSSDALIQVVHELRAALATGEPCTPRRTLPRMRSSMSDQLPFERPSNSG